MFACLHGKGVEQGGLDEDQTAEIEVIADTAELVVDDRMLSAFSPYEVIVVGISHCSIRIRSDAQQTVEGSFTQDELGRLCL